VGIKKTRKIKMKMVATVLIDPNGKGRISTTIIPLMVSDLFD